MTMADKSAFARLMLKLNTAYDKKASSIKADIYWRGLLAVPLDLLEAAVERWLESSSRFPRISDLRTASDAVMDARIAEQRRIAGGRTRDRQASSFICIACEDTGWRYHAGRDGPPFASVFEAVLAGATHVGPCPCRERNSAYRSRRPPRRYGSDTDSRAADRYVASYPR